MTNPNNLAAWQHAVATGLTTQGYYEWDVERRVNELNSQLDAHHAQPPQPKRYGFESLQWSITGEAIKDGRFARLTPTRHASQESERVIANLNDWRSRDDYRNLALVVRPLHGEFVRAVDLDLDNEPTVDDFTWTVTR